MLDVTHYVEIDARLGTGVISYRFIVTFISENSFFKNFWRIYLTSFVNNISRISLEYVPHSMPAVRWKASCDRSIRVINIRAIVINCECNAIRHINNLHAVYMGFESLIVM